MLYTINMRSFSSKLCLTCSREFTPNSGVQKYCNAQCKPKFSYNHKCNYCNTSFSSKQKLQTFCSTKCYSLSGSAANAGSKGGSLFRIHPGGYGFHPDAPEIIKDGHGEPKSWSEDNGYILYYWDHPATKTKRIHEHRAVAFAMGHNIEGMHVDHIDTNRKNNDPSNLSVMAPSEHMKKTANKDSGNAFYKWAKIYHPEWIEEWKGLSLVGYPD